jgi:hypothetical protein
LQPRVASTLGNLIAKYSTPTAFANSYRVGYGRLLLPQGSSNPGLKFANAVGVQPNTAQFDFGASRTGFCASRFDFGASHSGFDAKPILAFHSA